MGDSNQPERRQSAPTSQTVWTGEASESGRARGVDEAGTAPGDVATSFKSLQAIDWTLPPIELLDPRRARDGGATFDHEANGRRIEEKLLSFEIPARVIAINRGPAVTQYEVKPDNKVKISRIAALADDLAMALSARSIRVEAPIPGKDIVGIEVPNWGLDTVDFRAALEDSFWTVWPIALTFAIGRDVSGHAYAVDLVPMPHLLVAGNAGSGKSAFVNSMVASFLMHARPDDVRLVLVDLKRVELAPYNGLPHLLQHVIVEPHEAKAVLNWAVREMEERYKILAGHSVRNIAAYNSRPEVAGEEADDRMPYIVLIIDELADLIDDAGFAEALGQVLEQGRVAGIHLVAVAGWTSPTPGLAQVARRFPALALFAMRSAVTHYFGIPADTLIGRGDMLYQPVDLPRPVRMQGVFVGDTEVAEITKHWLDQTGGRTYYDEDILAFTDAEEGNGADGGQFGWLRKYGVDEMTIPAAELVATSQRASTSMLQTKLKLGFARASRVMDELERYGIIGPQDPRSPASPRQIYGPDNWLRTIDGGDGADE